MIRFFPVRALPGLFLFLALPGLPPLAEEVGLHDYALSDLEGTGTNLGSYKGKILVVEFFATWCPSCRKDLPEVASLQENYPSEQVAFVAVSADSVSGSSRFRGAPRAGSFPSRASCSWISRFRRRMIIGFT